MFTEIFLTSNIKNLYIYIHTQWRVLIHPRRIFTVRESWKMTLSKLSILFRFSMRGEDNARRDLRVTLQNGFSTLTMIPVAVRRRVNHLFVCISVSTSVCSSRRTEGRTDRSLSRHSRTSRRDVAKNWCHQRKRGSSRRHCVRASKARVYTYTRRDVSSPSSSPSLGGGRKSAEGKGESGREEAGGVSGGHLRLGHFVLSPCSVFTVVRRRKEATYAPVRSSLYQPSRLHCLINGRRFSW